MSELFGTLLDFSVPQLIALLIGTTIFFAVILVGVIKDEIDNKHSRKPRSEDEWLFSRWDTKLYDAFIQTPPEKVLKQLGFEQEKYLKDCAVIKNFFPNFKKLAADKLIGFGIIILSMFAFILTGVSGSIIYIITAMAGYILYMGDVNKVKKQAQQRRLQLQTELPRFLDLFQTALYINMPVNEAIVITAQHLKGTIIADELLASMAETHVGAVSWEMALQDIATKYEVDNFSDFVLYLITGYEKGLSIYDVVRRQTIEAREHALISAEENANRVNTAILVPIMVYKLIPLILIVAFPIMLQFFGNNTIF